MEIMEDLVGPYKWGTLTLVVVPSHSRGIAGMENPNMITMAPQTIMYQDEKYPNPVLIHEIAHQWFGNTISYPNFQHIWISEAFTTYLTNLVLGKILGEKFYQPLKSKITWDINSNTSIVTNLEGKYLGKLLLRNQ